MLTEMLIVDLIDCMLIVDPERRYTVDQCLKHPWLTAGAPAVNDSTGGLVGGIEGLEVNRRAPVRERTLLATLNSVSIAAEIDGGSKGTPIKVFSKNKHRTANAPHEAGPAHQRAPDEFMEMGGKGDQQLFGDDTGSIYPVGDIATKKKAAGKPNGK